MEGGQERAGGGGGQHTTYTEQPTNQVIRNTVLTGDIALLTLVLILLFSHGACALGRELH